MVTAKTSKGNLLKVKVNCDIGSKTTLSIRLERIKVGSKGENTSEAKVLELIYIGDHIRCRMLVEGDENFIVKIPNAKKHRSKIDYKLTLVGLLVTVGHLIESFSMISS